MFVYCIHGETSAGRKEKEKKSKLRNASVVLGKKDLYSEVFVISNIGESLRIVVEIMPCDCS
jgi:hypothetical protein